MLANGILKIKRKSLAPPDAGALRKKTRPPAESWVQPPNEATINQAYQIFSQRVGQVEYLIGYEGNAFAFTGDVEEDLLSITSVHPMREEAVGKFLARAGADWSAVRGLVDLGQLIETAYDGRRFYVRSLHARRDEPGKT